MCIGCVIVLHLAIVEGSLIRSKLKKKNLIFFFFFNTKFANYVEYGIHMGSGPSSHQFNHYSG